MQIFIIDDDPISIDIMTSVLEGAGHTVAADLIGETAISQIREMRPDVVLTDLQMAAVDGFDVCKEIRAIARLGRTKVIVVSAHSAETWKARAAEAGADGYLEKPLDADKLMAMVEGDALVDA
jgi:CheY-like chemotaxis protein